MLCKFRVDARIPPGTCGLWQIVLYSYSYWNNTYTGAVVCYIFTDQEARSPKSKHDQHLSKATPTQPHPVFDSVSLNSLQATKYVLSNVINVIICINRAFNSGKSETRITSAVTSVTASVTYFSVTLFSVVLVK